MRKVACQRDGQLPEVGRGVILSCDQQDRGRRRAKVGWGVAAIYLSVLKDPVSGKPVLDERGMPGCPVLTELFFGE